MKIHRLDISNFRSIRSSEMNFGIGINVITGVNGAGKTSVLNAIEIMLSWVKTRMRLKTGAGQYPEFGDISQGAVACAITAYAGNEDNLSWGIVRVGREFRGPERPKSDLNMLTSYADKIAEEFHNSKGQISMPMVVKYSVNRSQIDVPTHVRKKPVLDAMALYEERLDAGSNLRGFYEWFREREDLEREIHEERGNFEYEDFQLKAVRKAISSVMDGYGHLHTRRRASAGFEIRKDGKVFRVDQLSDGEKCYLSLIGDIARRLAICNPVLDNPLEGEGIVLIDELELHLHPKWQGEAIDRFRRVFPNCQFFITTHSPHIVQNLRLSENDTLRVMDNGDSYDITMQYGLPVDNVLREVFSLDSLRPKDVTDGINKVWNLLDEGGL